MGRGRTIFGLLLSAIYLLWVAVLILPKIGGLSQLELNEIGDFFAGLFGPLAFLWLVLGYFQQGDELKQGTKALLLQADELKRSVEQQSIMAAAANQQIDVQRESVRLQQFEMDKALAPNFRFGCSSRSGGEGRGALVETAFKVKNSGHEVAEVSIECIPPIGDFSKLEVERFASGTERDHPLKFVVEEGGGNGVVLVSYLRADGKRIAEEFEYKIPESNPFVVINKPFVSAEPIG
ncbi:hypothetical protein PQS90_09090 [Pseudomonas sp. BLCC-B13]|uniref:hypothetical protein n=1 Tax=Pseudomonas sp. BLCC-B13 TaxID=3025314 RepID=UPI00234EA0EF|nr:hypothetical protein [Pseudomonas sp. BLCC-B13]MDC7825304.1 hypothetical protein [Pseudomonas sp. BLCC-B13]